MTDREERQHVIEVLQKMVDWMESKNYIVANPERRRALGYAIASIKTDLKYDLLYEETSGQADKATTKNDLEVDAISRSDVLKLMQDNWHTHNGDWAMEESMDDIRALPSVTPQEPILDRVRAEIETKYGQCDICEYFEDYDYEENCISEYRPIGDIADILEIIDSYKDNGGDK